MKKLLLSLILIFFCAHTQIYSQVITSYDFTGEEEETFPDDVTIASGVFLVTSNNSMTAIDVGNDNTAIADLDLFLGGTDYSVTWKESYGTPRRTGLTLRASGVNTIASGAKQGYLFQVNSSRNIVRVYTSDDDDYTLLSEAALVASGPDTPRWYSAAVVGEQLTMSYSDDGSNFTSLITITDDTYSSGSAQYGVGYGDGIGDIFIDDIVFYSATVADPETPSEDGYDFVGEVTGDTPANITVGNGAFIVADGTMEAVLDNVINTTVADLDKFDQATDYSITWQGSYTTPRRDGFTLRASGENTAGTGLKQGYVFQVNNERDDVRIYRSNARDYTQLGIATLTALGPDETRWYRASVSGTTRIQQ